MQFLNYYIVEVVGAYNPETVNTRRTRGGPVSLNPCGYQANLFVNSDNRKEFVINTYFNAYISEDSKDWNGGVGVTRHPAATYGKRYVFGKIDQTSILANIRLDWIFTPKLSLQLFIQPRISAGDFLDFKELARPHSYDLLVYGTHGSIITKDGGTYTVDPDGSGPAASFTFDNPKYNFTSIRGNAVLRWEYMPGSVLYFVQTQSRSNDKAIGGFNFEPSADKIWRMVPDNIFMIKMTYWWNR